MMDSKGIELVIVEYACQPPMVAGIGDVFQGTGQFGGSFILQSLLKMNQAEVTGCRRKSGVVFYGLPVLHGCAVDVAGLLQVESLNVVPRPPFGTELEDA